MTKSDVYVGTYEIGYEYVRVYLYSGTAGNTDFLPDDKGVAIIKFGADRKVWRDFVGVILHEAMEIAMNRLGLSYYPASGMNNSTSNVMFYMNHEQFEECCRRAADFISSALPDIEKAWKAWNVGDEK